MPWPWVSRRSYDELMHVTERLQEDLRISHQCLAEAQRHSSQLIAALRPVPMSTRIEVPPPQPLPVAKKDEVQEAIEVTARDNTLLARHLGREALRQKMEGADETEIINSILHWRPDAWGGDEPIA